jgi:hypothetical protein
MSMMILSILAILVIPSLVAIAITLQDMRKHRVTAKSEGEQATTGQGSDTNGRRRLNRDRVQNEYQTSRTQ